MCWAWLVWTEVGVRLGGEVCGPRLAGGRAWLADTDGGQLSVLGDRRALHPGQPCSVGGGPHPQSGGHIYQERESRTEHNLWLQQKTLSPLTGWIREQHGGWGHCLTCRRLKVEPGWLNSGGKNLVSICLRSEVPIPRGHVCHTRTVKGLNWFPFHQSPRAPVLM